jgi:hypothetical protein
VGFKNTGGEKNFSFLLRKFDLFHSENWTFGAMHGKLNKASFSPLSLKLGPSLSFYLLHPFFSFHSFF